MPLINLLIFVLFFCPQFSFLSLDAALGQPHYSSFMVGMDYQFRHPLTFVQRATNAIAAWGMHYFLRYPARTRWCCPPFACLSFPPFPKL